MAVFNEQFSSGIPFMDNSTKRFISELNKLSDAMKNGEGREYVFFVMDFLKDFCETHLALENKVMLQYDYYDYANHAEAHAKLREDVLSIVKNCEESGADHGTPLAVQRLMAGWLISHVSKTDKVLGDFIKVKVAAQKKQS